MSATENSAGIAERYHFSDFTWANYRKLLTLAKGVYEFRDYASSDQGGRFVLWRHDVDFSPRGALRFAELESEEGTTATYFFLLRSRFYNLLDEGSRDVVARIAALGHEVGLHFEYDYHGALGEAGLVDRLREEKEILEAVTGTEVRAFSFHMPTEATLRFTERTYAGLLNVDSEYFRSHVDHCSDSNGYWRHRRLEDVLRETESDRLQVLTHPVWWQYEPMPPAERLRLCVDQSGREMLAWYERVASESGRKANGWE